MVFIHAHQNNVQQCHISVRYEFLTANLIAMPANSHKKIVRFNISMNEVFVVNIFHSTNHLWHKTYILSPIHQMARAHNEQLSIVVKLLERTYKLACSGMTKNELECGPMPNVTAALPNIGGALCSTPQSLADAHY